MSTKVLKHAAMTEKEKLFAFLATKPLDLTVKVFTNINSFATKPENQAHSEFPRNFFEYLESVSNMPITMFDWAESPEGFEFWDAFYDEYLEFVTAHNL